MSPKWEHEDEFLQLNSASRRALRKGDMALYEKLQARLRVFDDIIWGALTAVFQEMKPYHTLVEALQQTAIQLGREFPDLNNPRYNTGDGKSIFGVSDGVRTVQVFPLESRGYIDIELYERGECYKGQTTSLADTTIVICRWIVERVSIEELHRQFAWMSREPFRLTGPRVTYE